MTHVPHLVLTPPWEGNLIEPSDNQWSHLTKVLRMGPGREISYTDGTGTVGVGTLTDHGIERGGERKVPRPTNLAVAVAPPARRERQRFLVEKLAEMGVSRLVWLDTRYGERRVASEEKLATWIASATEQSRGAYLMDVSDELVGLAELEGTVVVCRQDGEPNPGDVDVVAIGPEGGFAEEEVAENVPLWSLGPTVLRVETAALVAVARLTGF